MYYQENFKKYIIFTKKVDDDKQPMIFYTLLPSNENEFRRRLSGQI